MQHLALFRVPKVHFQSVSQSVKSVQWTWPTTVGVHRQSRSQAVATSATVDYGLPSPAYHINPSIAPVPACSCCHPSPHRYPPLRPTKSPPSSSPSASFFFSLLPLSPLPDPPSSPSPSSPIHPNEACILIDSFTLYFCLASFFLRRPPPLRRDYYFGPTVSPRQPLACTLPCFAASAATSITRHHRLLDRGTADRLASSFCASPRTNSFVVSVPPSTTKSRQSRSIDFVVTVFFVIPGY